MASHIARRFPQGPSSHRPRTEMMHVSLVRRRRELCRAGSAPWRAAGTVGRRHRRYAPVCLRPLQPPRAEDPRVGRRARRVRRRARGRIGERRRQHMPRSHAHLHLSEAPRSHLCGDGAEITRARWRNLAPSAHHHRPRARAGATLHRASANSSAPRASPSRQTARRSTWQIGTTAASLCSRRSG